MMRHSGILMHITSLPAPYGVGTMGKSALEFIDFLEKAGQTLWQILPLSPTGYGDSPYQSCSTYAGNHYLIDLDALVQDGLLTSEELSGIFWGGNAEKVDFGLLYQHRLPVLRKAYSRFTDAEALEAFCRENGDWLPDFTLYMALKDEYQGLPWFSWPDQLKKRNPDALWQTRQNLRDSIRFYSFVQYLFFKQWNALRDYAHKKNVRIIGDVPIYVPMDSVDVWANPELFQLDGDLKPEAVAGVPPDGFTADGQLWGNPLYRWEAHKKEHYGWWLRRLGAAGKLYDIVRLDHFRGFEAYWSVPATDSTARNGHWVEGPNMDFINAVKTGLPKLELIAEDLGYLTPSLLKMRDDSGWPGMKVLEFAFDSKEPSDYLPHTYPENSVCYTGTHDNMTMRQWFETADAEAVEYAKSYMALSEQEGYVWGTIRTACASVSRICVVQLQDYLNLSGAARMNCPGTSDGTNWTWRVQDGLCTDELAEKIYKLTALYGRI
ncbi:MAG: 4-alpha-glucanotransferase [Oscillospiraceae bacterium]|nr:4-alpha-glucanotransferase [Oscillospiraceae bacterium]